MSWSNGKLLAGKDEAPVAQLLWGLAGLSTGENPNFQTRPKAWVLCGHSRTATQQGSLDFRVPIMLFTYCFSNKFSSLPNKVTQYSKEARDSSLDVEKKISIKRRRLKDNFFLLCLETIRLYVTAGMPKWTKLSQLFRDLLSATRPCERKVYCTLITNSWKSELQH